MIIDAHCHAGNFYGFISGDHPEEELVGEFDKANVDLGLISICYSYDFKNGNERARLACEKHKGRLLAYIYLNPVYTKESLAELERCAKYDCFRGVKLHPSNDTFYPFFDGFYPLYARIQELGLPILWHSGTSPYSHPLQIAYVARQFPKVPFILGHFGLSDLTWECFPAADLAPNIYVDTTANPIIPVYNEFIERLGAERMLWGSDFPFYDVSYELMKLNHFKCKPAQKEMIKTENARRIFGI